MKNFNIWYNAEDKELSIIVGAGMGSNLSVNLLTGIVADIKSIFPDMTDAQLNALTFHEIGRSSRSYAGNWVARMKYDLKVPVTERGDVLFGDVSIYAVFHKIKGQNGWNGATELAADCINMVLYT